MKKYFAEFFGTFWLVFGGCGSAVLAAAFPELGIGFAGVALAFGLTVLTMAYAVGHVSGAHFNPAVSVGLATAGRMPWSHVPGYIAAQVVGGIVAAAVLYLIASGKVGFGEHSPGGYALSSVIACEIVMTAMFLVVILGVTHKNAPAGFAPLAIGLCLTLIHLVSIPVSNTSVNPARSLGVAFFSEPWALQQMWVFWLAPLAGGVLGAIIHRMISED
jgi:aquaporin Z